MSCIVEGREKERAPDRARSHPSAVHARAPVGSARVGQATRHPAVSLSLISFM